MEQALINSTDTNELNLMEENRRLWEKLEEARKKNLF